VFAHKKVKLVGSIGSCLLNRPRPFIFIGWRGLAPAGVEILINLVLNTTPTQFTMLGPGQTVNVTRSNRPCDVETFRKPYLPHPDSELNVLYIDLDLLDETYPMGKSKLRFEDF
jgi:hypothetical protein